MDYSYQIIFRSKPKLKAQILSWNNRTRNSRSRNLSRKWTRKRVQSQDRWRKQALTNVEADYGGAGHWSRRQKLTCRRRGRRRWERNKKRITCFVAWLSIFWFSLFFPQWGWALVGPIGLHGRPTVSPWWPQNEDRAIGSFWEEKPLGMSRLSCCFFLFFFPTNEYLVQILLNYWRKSDYMKSNLYYEIIVCDVYIKKIDERNVI